MHTNVFANSMFCFQSAERSFDWAVAQSSKMRKCVFIGDSHQAALLPVKLALLLACPFLMGKPTNQYIMKMLRSAVDFVVTSTKQGWRFVLFGWDWLCWEKSHWLISDFIFSSKNLNLHGIMMELWNYDGIWTFYDGIWTDLSINLMEILPIDPVGVKVSLVLGHLPGLARVSTPIS